MHCQDHPTFRFVHPAPIQTGLQMYMVPSVVNHLEITNMPFLYSLSQSFHRILPLDYENRGVPQNFNSATRPCVIRIVLSGLLLIAVKLMHSVDHRHDILYRGAALHDMDGVEDVAAVGREDLQTLEHLPAYLFRRAERQDLLGRCV